MEAPRTGGSSPADEPPGPSPPALSVVIPAYNEADRIGPSLERILSYMEDHHPGAEIIVVDDGSTDGTGRIASSFDAPGLRIVTNASNSGKGFSVRRGMLEAKGQRVLFTDADLSAPIEELGRLIEAVDDGADIAIGSRALDRSRIRVHQSPTREWGGILYNAAVQWILGLRIQDTQCGFKLFHRERTAPVFEAQTIDGFGFDPEVLFLATRRGLRIAEVPVDWSHDGGSKVRFFSDGVRMLLDLFRIRWRWATGRYRPNAPSGSS